MITRRRLLGGAGALFVGATLPRCRTRPAEVEGATSAERAVRAARRFAGETITIGSETGAQAQGLARHAAPRWEELTGIRVDVVEMGLPAEMERRLVQEHEAGTGALDCASVAPAWLAHLLDVGALQVLDPYVETYMLASDLDDYLPRYRALGREGDHRYGLFDDGDSLLLYFRKDLFEDAGARARFADRFGRPLGDPRAWGWADFVDAARFFTAAEEGRYGLAPFTQELRWGWFQAFFQARGGRFFEPETMAAEVASETGVRTMRDLIGLTEVMPPSNPNEPDPLLVVSSWLAGNTAMATFWPPLARWSEAYGPRAIGSTSKSFTVGRTGYALLPGQISQLSVGFVLSVMARSRRPEAAYLFIQWLTSPEVSLERVMLPYGLRDPYRRSHLQSSTFRALWPSAGAYLDTLERAAARAWFDLGIPGALEYAGRFHVAVSEIRLGRPVEEAVHAMATEWDRITRERGRGAQRRAYLRWLQASAPAAR